MPPFVVDTSAPAPTREKVLRDIRRVRPEFDEVFQDQTEAASAQMNLQQGASGSRMFYVVGIANTTPVATMWDALVAPGIPQIGQFHPIVTTMPVTNVRADPIPGFSDGAKVLVSYGFLPGDAGVFDQDPDDDQAQPSIEVGSGVVEAVTNFDRFGNLITVEWDEPAGDGVGPPVRHTQVADVTYQIPLDIVTFRRRERQSPGTRSRFYKGHVNSIPVFRDEKRVWLCTMYDGESSDGGSTYNVTYQFQRGSTTPAHGPNDTLLLPPGRTVQGWDTVVRFEQSDGTVPPDLHLLIGNLASGIEGAIKLVENYPEADFHQIRPRLPLGPRFAATN